MQEKLNLDRIALFLDFDGTLVDFADSPDAVRVPYELRELLLALNEHLSGALALVSGRSLESLDSLLQLPQLAAAGGHGAEWRLNSCEVHHSKEVNSEALATVREKLSPIAAEHALLLEDKGHSLALHFRSRPNIEASLDEFIEAEVRHLPGIRIISGNCVREVQAKGVDKGMAVARFMQLNPFSERKPCYIGDDTTDEDAFGWINEHDGLSIKVGTGTSRAACRLSGVADVYRFLQQSLTRGSE